MGTLFVQQSFGFPGPHHRKLVTDKFYTRHAIERALFVSTDGKIRFLGTVTVTNLSGKDRFIGKRAVDLVKDS